jgi:hypothetical protein
MTSILLLALLGCHARLDTDAYGPPGTYSPEAEMAATAVPPRSSSTR